ncbi:MAG: hypothetical protein NTV51_28295 [Verrucomicrobia bacterium]|nr:hypothetical protein [Verrucomicrobiota bacterium]
MALPFSPFAPPRRPLCSWRWIVAALVVTACARAHFPFSYSASESIGLVQVTFPPSGVVGSGEGPRVQPEYDYLRLQPLVAGYTWQYRGTISNSRVIQPAELKVEVLSATRTGPEANPIVEYTVRHTVTFGTATAVTTISGVVSSLGDRVLTTKTVSNSPGLPTLDRTFADGGLRALPRRLQLSSGIPTLSYALMTESVSGRPTTGLGGEMKTEVGNALTTTTNLGTFETLLVVQQLTLGALGGGTPVRSSDGSISSLPGFTRRRPDVRVATAYAADVGPVSISWTQSEPDRESVHGTLLLVAANFPVTPRPLSQPQLLAGPEPRALEPGATLALSAEVIGIPAGEQSLPPSSTPVTNGYGIQFHWTTPRGERWTHSAKFSLSGLTAADAGDYQLEVIAPGGTARSDPARVTVTAAATSSRLLNVASRAPGGQDADTLIAGLVLSPSPTSALATRRLLFRAVGPALRDFGVADAETDPTLVIYDGSNREIARCDNWDSSREVADRVAAAVTALGTFPLPAGSRDAALVLDLGPGAYTAHLVGAGTGAPTVGLVEIYDAGAGNTAGPRIANLSTRCRIGAGDRILIPGIVVADGSARLLVRALGPQLRQYGITDALPDPEITLYAADGTPVAYGDNWSADSATAAAGATLPPSVLQAAQLAGAAPLISASKDAALVVTLPRGSYTLHVRSRDPQQTGVVVAEVFLLNP